MEKRLETWHVLGMTCASCEERIRQTLSAIPGVKSADAKRQSGIVSVEYDEGTTSAAVLQKAIERAGYRITDKRTSGAPLAIGIGMALVAAYLIAGASGLIATFPTIDTSLGFGMLFLAGLLTSIHCVAMCGGISLSQSVAATRSETIMERLRPGLLYNGGRVVSYTIIGGIVGALGSVFSFAPVVKGAIAGAAGLLMLYFGLSMLGIVPAGFLPSHLLPKRFGEIRESARRSVSGRGPLAIGLLNGLIPCGPLQTMQLYALGTGSLIAGALSMFAFSLGTVPLMLSFGIVTTVLPRRMLPSLVKASAMLVMVLGAVTMVRAASLAGLSLAPAQANSTSLPSERPIRVASLSQTSPAIVATIKNGVQTVVTEFTTGAYVPFTVQTGVPVQWTIRATRRGLNGCNNPVTIPAYGISAKLVPGDNLIEFMPDKPGTIVYTCWMGMVSSQITVVPSGATMETR